jgi:ATP-dependent Clp protease protease subunit
MIHQPLISGGLSGQASDIEIHTKHLVRTKNDLHQFMVDKTRQPLEKIEKDMDRDYYMGANEAVEYGVVDKIIGV